MTVHSSINQLYPQRSETRLFGEHARMGFMLHEKYGNQVFQILFHNQMLVNSDRISQFIEKVAFQRQNRPFGCDMIDSPLGNLTDNKGKHFKLQPGLCLSDIAAGYIYLKPIAEQKRCEWVNGYFTEEMFAKHKRYYEAKTEKKLNRPEEVNRAFTAYTGW